MPVPRWFWIACSLIIVNAALVTGTSLQRLVWADSSQADPGAIQATDSDTVPAAEQSDAVGGIAPTDGKPHVLPPPPPGAVSDPLTLPGAAGTESLEHDPVFSEIKKMFSGPSPTPDALLVAPSNASSIDNDDLDRLERRLDTVIGLTESARSLVEEAAEFSRGGQPAQAQDMLDMATQLRRMAIKLLDEN